MFKYEFLMPGQENIVYLMKMCKYWHSQSVDQVSSNHLDSFSRSILEWLDSPSRLEWPSLEWLDSLEESILYKIF